MKETLMMLPAADPKAIRLIRIPTDYDEHEVYRHVTGLIAEVEERNPGHTWEDIRSLLEDHGFDVVSFILGPSLD